MRLGANAIDALRLGSNEVTAAYLGADLVWTSSDPLATLIASLFGNDEQGGLWLPGPDTCYTDEAGTTPAAENDTVARMDDLSGNGNHATQASADARPALRKTAGGLWYLQFDGVDDAMSGPVINAGRGFHIAAAAEIDQAGGGAAPQPVLSAGSQSATNSLGIYVRRDTVRRPITVLRGPSAVSYSVQIENAFTFGVPAILEGFHQSDVLYVDSNEATAGSVSAPEAGVGTAGRNLLIFSSLDGNFYGGTIVRAELSPTVRTALTEYLAERAGVTLP